MTRKKKTYRIPIETGDGEEAAERLQENTEEAEASGNGRESKPMEEKRTPSAEERAREANRAAPRPESGKEKTEGSVQEASPEEILEHLQRLQAEFANYRKRTDRERLETGIWAQGQLVEKLLPVLDDLDRATDSLGSDDSPAAQGLAMIREKLYRILEEAGLERVPAAGEAFDPDMHEALMTQQVEPDQVGKVLQEMEPGYRFRGRLLRPARVQVGVAAEDWD